MRPRRGRVTWRPSKEERMRRRPTIFIVLPCLLLFALLSSPLAAGKRPITEQDLFRFVWIADPQISPDGSRVAFVRVHVNEKKEGYETEIWTVSTRGEPPLRLTVGPRDSSPRWSPDGGRLVFARSIDKDGQPQPPQLYVLPMGGGEAWPLTSLPKGAGPPAWSHDGSKIYFTADRNPEPYYELPTTALYAVPAPGGEVTPVVSMDGVVGPFRFGPGGRQVAFVGAVTRPARSYDQPQLFVADAAPGSHPRAVAPDLDRDIGANIIGDQHAPRGGAEAAPFWAADGRSVIAAVSDRGTSNLRRFDLKTGRVQMVTTGNHEVSDWTATPDGSKIAVLISTPTSLGDLYLVAADGKLSRLTDTNK